MLIEEDKIRVKGRWLVQCHNADGSLAWEEEVPNMVVSDALNDLLNVYFASGTQKTSWFLGLIDNAGYSAIASGDTMASHSGWSESVAYTAGTRPAWTPGAAAGGSIINPTPAVVTMNATTSIRGAFITSNNTKGGTTGTLFATGLFGSIQSLVSTQALSFQYQCPLTAT